jgi:hypothetical protein
MHCSTGMMDSLIVWGARKVKSSEIQMVEVYSLSPENTAWSSIWAAVNTNQPGANPFAPPVVEATSFA